MTHLLSIYSPSASESDVCTMQAPSQIQPVAVPQQLVMGAITRPKTKTYEAYQAKSSVRLGASQIIIGILCIVFNAAAIILGPSLSDLSHGMWGGLVFILAGSFGVAAGKYRTSFQIVAFMVLSIIAAVLALCVLAFAAIGLAKDNDYSRYLYYYSDSKETRVAMNALLIALAVTQTIIAIWSSAICCGAVCCGNKSGPANFVQEVRYINQAPGTYYVQTGPAPMALPQGGTPLAYTTASPPGDQQRAPAPQAGTRPLTRPPPPTKTPL